MRNGPQSAFDLIDKFFEDMTTRHVGGRALDAVIRPYAAKTAGKPLFSLFELQRTAFELVFITPKDAAANSASSTGSEDSSKSWTTEIYVPQFHYGLSMQPEVVVSDGNWLFDPKKQTIYWTINPSEVSPIPGSKNAPSWISCPRRIASPALMETHNFHTLQMFKSKAAANSIPSSKGVYIGKPRNAEPPKGCTLM